MRVVLPRRRQAGQSIAEFLLALAVLVPIFMAITYAGRYGDVLQTAVEASRYAAMQRAIQPSASVLPDAKIQDQMRARFFVAPTYLHGGLLQSDDSVGTIGAKGTPPLWRDLSGAAMLSSPNAVTLTFAHTPISSFGLQGYMKIMSTSAGKTYSDAQVARVEVPLLNRLSLSSSSSAKFTLAAATAAAGDPLSSAGSAATRDAASTGAVSTYIPAVVTDAIDIAMWIFEPAQPKFGCIKPDAVPHGRLQPYQGVEGCM